MTAEKNSRRVPKPRLQRLSNVFASDPVYFVTLCTHARRPLLASDSTHAAVRTFCDAGTVRGVFVGRYVLMPDHGHAFLMFARGSTVTLSPWTKFLKNCLSKHWRTRGIPAPHWQKGFFDHVLRSAESYSEKWSYVEQNPVRAGLVPRASDWPFAGTINELAY